MKCTMNATLEQSKEGFGCVGVHVASGVFALAVVDRLVATRELLTDSLVEVQFVSLNRGLLVDVLSDGRLEVVGVDVFHNPRSDSPVALDKGHHRNLLGSPAPLADDQVSALVPLPLAGLAADVGFIYFDCAL